MINYQKKLEETLASLSGGETLLLHDCCAPCGSYVLEYLSAYFNITLLYYNPNISPESEYEKRVAELKRLLKEMPLKNNAELIEGKYEPEKFAELSKGLETLPERGERCFKCYALRLEETAKLAAEKNFDFFSTTLSVSPHKDAEKLNEIGAELEKKYGVKYLYSDFKKREGYKRSIALSKEYGLYRQNYCGCVYSRKAAELRDKK